jgi:hypothetical protein
MKLPERFTSDRAEEALDPEVEAQLAVIDACLAGDPAPEGEPELAQLTRELRAERAEPDPGFAAQLDNWAASGFPRAKRHTPSPRSDAAARRDRFAGFFPRRLAAPVGAVATLIVVVGIAVSTGGLQSGDGDSAGGGGTPAVPEPDATGDPVTPAEPVVQDDGGGASEAGRAEELSGDIANARDARGVTAKDGGSVPPGQRKVASTADMVLAAEPEEVRDVSDGVNSVVNRYRGIVVSSSVQTGEGNRLGSSFQLRLPAANLQAALADLSELAHVQSRTESTEDITGRFISAEERIDELNANRESILNQLEEADTPEEAEALRRQLDIVNARLSSARAALDDVRRRVQLVPVSVSIVAEEGAGDGDWGISEALDDAAGVLSTAAGVLVVAGAVLLPVAIVALIVGWALRARTGRARDRALDE